MYDNIITGEENAFEDLELYCIDDPDNLQNSIQPCICNFTFLWLGLAFFGEDRLATWVVGVLPHVTVERRHCRQATRSIGIASSATWKKVMSPPRKKFLRTPMALGISRPLHTPRLLQQ